MWAWEGDLCKQSGPGLGRWVDFSAFCIIRIQCEHLRIYDLRVLVALSCWLSLSLCLNSSSQTSHSSTFQPLLTLRKFTDVSSLGREGMKGLKCPDNPIWQSISNVVMCVSRVCEAGDGQGELDFNLWKEMSQSSELSEDISYNRCTARCVQLSLYCTLYWCTLPSVCHSDQLENISVATNKHWDI